MEFIVSKALKGPDAVKSHPLFGSAVFIECGLHDPEHFCYDHHSMAEAERWSLTSAGMIQQELLQRRRMPTTIVMNHIRHLDNLVALYLLWFRGLATSSVTSQFVAVAELMDRIGPMVTPSIPQLEHSVLLTAQNLIPFKEWEESDEKLSELGIKAVESIRGMATRPLDQAKYEAIWEAPDKKFIIVKSGEFIGNTLYDQGYDGYVAFTSNADGSFKWTFARASEYVPFDIPAAYAELNQIEGLTSATGWGGRTTIGGSPRASGTKMDPQKVLEVLKKHYQG